MTDRDVDPPRHGAAVAGACMGFRVRSTVPLRLLRDDASPGPGPGVIPGAGLAELLVDETEPPRPEPRSAPIATWEPRPDNPFHARLYDDAPDGAWFWTSDAGWYHVEPAAGRVALPIDADPLRREIRLWGVPAAIGLAARGVLSLHAAAVDIGGQAILIGAPGHHGKTTLAAAAVRAGHRLLSEDTTACRPTGVPVAFPGPAILRVRPDMAAQVSTPASSEVHADEDRVFRVVDEAARGSGAGVPLRAIVLLRPGAGPPRIAPVPSPQAVRDLWALAFKLPTDASRASTFVSLAELSAATTVVDLHRPMTVEALPATIAALEQLVAAG